MSWAFLAVVIWGMAYMVVHSEESATEGRMSWVAIIALLSIIAATILRLAGL